MTLKEKIQESAKWVGAYLVICLLALAMTQCNKAKAVTSVQRLQGAVHSDELDKLLAESQRFTLPYEVSRDFWKENWIVDDSMAHVFVLYSVFNDTLADRQLPDSAKVAKEINTYMTGLMNAVQRVVRSYDSKTEFPYFALEIGWASGWQRYDTHYLIFGYFQSCNCSFKDWNEVALSKLVIFGGTTR